MIIWQMTAWLTSHLLNAFFIDVDSPEECLHHFHQEHSETPDGIDAQIVSHFIQDLHRLLVYLLHGQPTFFTDL